MINFQLRCHDDHAFEAWFKDRQSCDNQASVGLVECPYCGSIKITNAPVALQEAPPQVPQLNVNDTQVRAHEVAQKILDAVSKLKDFAEQNYDNVGALEAIEAAEESEDDIRASVEDEILDIEGLPSRSTTND